jgi:hypothetical protein
VSGEEKRVYRRFATAITVELSGPGGLQTCVSDDVSLGGCQVTVLMPLRQGEALRVRLRSERTHLEPAGAATVAWASREPPYQAGLRFSDPLIEAAVPFFQAVVGPARFLNGVR